MGTRIAIHGSTGRLGQLIAEEAGVSFVGSVTRTGEIPECDVVIDVSSADGLQSLLTRLNGQPLLVGTTGDLPMGALEAYSQGAAVALVSNFSAGVPLLLDLIRKAVDSMPDDWRVEVVEAHHDQKKDAPSGTALRMIRAIEDGGGPVDPPTHSIRAGDTIGEHTVWLAGPGERIEIKHVATKRSVFAIGALRWASWLQEQPAGLYTP